MVDTAKLFRKLVLHADPENLVPGSTIVAAADLPAKWDPAASGPAIIFSIVGGSPHKEITPLAKPIIRTRCWAGEFQYDVARGLYLKLHDWLHGRTNVDLSPDGYVMSCIEVMEGQDITDPDTGYATVSAMFEMTAR